MIKEQNKEIIRQLYSEMSTKKETRTSKARATSITQYTYSARPANLRAFKKFFTDVAAAFPDYELTIETMMVKEDKVFVQYSIAGTHEGNFMGVAPSHERMTITGIDVFRLDEGKIIEHWDAPRQICALPYSGFQPPIDNTTSRSNFVNSYGRKLFSLKT